MKKLHTTDGFTLVENMVAVLLLAVGLAGAWMLMGSTLRGNAFSARMTEATTLAEDKVEDLHEAGYGSISSGSDVVGNYNRVWTIAAGPVAKSKQIDVVVSWDNTKGHTHNATVKTLITE